jgi:hypothetical protein
MWCCRLGAPDRLNCVTLALQAPRTWFGPLPINTGTLKTHAVGQKPWMKHMGKLKDLHKETVRINKVIE